jgi:hypothetical protein
VKRRGSLNVGVLVAFVVLIAGVVLLSPTLGLVISHTLAGIGSILLSMVGNDIARHDKARDAARSAIHDIRTVRRPLMGLTRMDLTEALGGAIQTRNLDEAEAAVQSFRERRKDLLAIEDEVLHADLEKAFDAIASMVRRYRRTVQAPARLGVGESIASYVGGAIISRPELSQALQLLQNSIQVELRTLDTLDRRLRAIMVPYPIWILSRGDTRR